MIVVVLLVIAVDLLLMVATARLLGISLHPVRMVAAVGLDVLCWLLGCLPGMLLGREFFWRAVAAMLTGITAFGFSSGAVVFPLLVLSLGGITGEKPLSVLLGAAGIGFACLILGRERRYVSVELWKGGERICFTALRDTGNTLRDPITGKPVLVVSAEIAGKLTGLSPAQLEDPVGNIRLLPGLRLIPCKTVAGSGFLLAMQISAAKIGNRKGSVLVALSPQMLGTGYQALTGGNV